MSLRNTQDNFGSVAKFFHWFTALLVLLMLCVGASFHLFSLGSFFMPLLQIHKSLGMTLLVFMVLRLLWRWINPTPRFPDTMSAWEKFAARLMHALLYITVIAMPIVGMIMTISAGNLLSFWGLLNVSIPWISLSNTLSQTMHETHEILAWIITALIIIHTAAALKHHFWDKNNILKRMM